MEDLEVAMVDLDLVVDPDLVVVDQAVLLEVSMDHSEVRVADLEAKTDLSEDLEVGQGWEEILNMEVKVEASEVKVEAMAVNMEVVERLAGKEDMKESEHKIFTYD